MGLRNYSVVGIYPLQRGLTKLREAAPGRRAWESPSFARGILQGLLWSEGNFGDSQGTGSELICWLKGRFPKPESHT